MPTLTKANVILNWNSPVDINSISHYRVYVDDKIVSNVSNQLTAYTIIDLLLYIEHSIYIIAVKDKSNVKSNVIKINLPRENDLNFNLNINI